MGALALVLPLLACRAAGTHDAGPDAVVARLQAVDQPALALHFRDVGVLRVLRVDAGSRAEPGMPVTFTPVGDSGGTALASDSAITDEHGIASVTVAAGFEEASFKVIASSDGAPDLPIAVTVTRAPFAAVSVLLSYGGAHASEVTTLRALAYKNVACRDLPPKRNDPTTDYQGSAGASSLAVINFDALPAAQYAIVGRAEAVAGEATRLIARGCVDVLEAQLAAGQVQVPVPLAAATPVLADAYQLEAHYVFDFGDGSPIAPWIAFGDCPFGVAQALLDGIGDALGPGPLASGLMEHRGPVDNLGCRPAIHMGKPSLDVQLQALLVSQGSPAEQVPGVTADLEAAVAAVDVQSRLALTGAANPGAWVASHALTEIRLTGALGAHAMTYKAVAIGLPVPSADGVPVTFDGETMTLGDHGLTLRLPQLWGRALTDIALQPRGLPQDVHGFVAAIVASARVLADNKLLTGCPAIENLLCRAAEVMNLPCTLAPACESAEEGVTSNLLSSFAARPGLDIMLSGKCDGVDADGNLEVETLGRGTFNALVGVSPERIVPVTGSFTGARLQVP